MEIFPHVHRFPIRTLTVPPAQHTNSYIVGKDNTVVIIDMGSDNKDDIDLIVNYVKDLHGPPALTSILLTHTHKDHSLGAERLSSLTGADVLVHAEEYTDISDIPERKILSGGEVIVAGGLHLRAIHTPGHSPGHICWYLEEEKILFTGDHIVGEGTVVIAPPEGDMGDYLRSLEAVKSLQLHALCPGHGPVIGSPYDKIQEYIDHRHMRERQILEGLSQGITTIEQLVARIYADVPSLLHPLAAFSVKAHLIKLERDGRVKSQDGKYSPV